MLTLDSLREYGADVNEGLRRCVNNEKFYLSLVKRSVDVNGAAALAEAICSGDLDRAFGICHSMKGVFGNLSLTPLLTPVTEMTELLRAKKDADYGAYVEEITLQMKKLDDICSN